MVLDRKGKQKRISKSGSRRTSNLKSLEDNFEAQMKAAGLPTPAREYRFHDKRRFRFDFAFPELKLAIEIHGGEWVRGRHMRAPGFLRDCDKMNLAIICGWRVLVFGGTHVKKGTALEQTELALATLFGIKGIRK